MSIKKRIRELRRRFPDLEVSISRGGHLCLSDAEGRAVAHCPATPSDRRAFARLDSDVRRTLAARG